jgi:F420-non-reducing hydrogenase small subunit
VNRAEPRKKLAVYTATGCRACEQGILDLNYEVNELGRFADPVFWPYVLGTPWDALPDEVDVAFFAGAITTEADREAALRLRGRSRLLVAVGACAAFGGLPGLADLAALPARGEPVEPRADGAVRASRGRGRSKRALRPR